MKLKQKSKIEHLKGIIRQLEAENERLSRLLSKYENEDGEEYESIKKGNECSKCDEGILKTVEVAGRLITKCNNCDYRKVEKL